MASGVAEIGKLTRLSLSANGFHRARYNHSCYHVQYKCEPVHVSVFSGHILLSV